MSGGWPVTGDGVYVDTSSDLVNAFPGANVTGDAAANTKGSYTTVIASTAADASLMAVVTRILQTGGAFSVDIAIGAAASEQIIAADLVYYVVNSNSSRILIPCQIPAGTRISARCQSGLAGPNTIAAGVTLFNGGFPMLDGCAGVDAIGFQSSVTRGTTVTATGTVGLKGSYAQLIAATARDYRGFFLDVDQSFSDSTDQAVFFDIAFGAGGSEVIFLPDEFFRANTAGAMGPIGPHTFYPIPIPSGTRIAARLTDNRAGFTSYQLTMYGVY